MQHWIGIFLGALFASLPGRQEEALGGVSILPWPRPTGAVEIAHCHSFPTCSIPAKPWSAIGNHIQISGLLFLP
jgi:hypothetical protein